MTPRLLLQRTAVGLSPLILGACFVSQVPLISVGEGTLPVAGPLIVCPDRPSECFDLELVADAYVSAPHLPREEFVKLRFSVLSEAFAEPVYILELSGADEADEFTYMIARRRQEHTASYGMLDAVLPSCSDLSGEDLQAFEAAGGRVTGHYSKTCRAPDLETLKTAWMAQYGALLDDEAWWAEARRGS